MTVDTAQLSRRQAVLRRVQAVFVSVILSSLCASLALGLETWRAVPSIVVILGTVVAFARERRRSGTVSQAVFFRGLATVMFTTLLLCGGLHAPWVVGVVTVSAAAAGALEPRSARILFAFALATVALSLVFELAPVGSLALPPSAYDREHEGAGRVLALVMLTVTLGNALVRGGSVVRLTLMDTERALQIEGLARAETLASIEAQTRLLSRMTRALGSELAAPLARARGRIERLRAASSGVDAERLAVLARETERFEQLLPRDGHAESPQSVPLARVAHDVVQMHAALAGERQVQLVVDGAPCAARADEQLVRQVLVNLVQNAIEASPAGASVVLRTRAAGDGRVAVEVDDQGQGLSPEAAPRLFSSGFTTKAAGSGIGLVVARALAARLGGELALANRGDGPDARGCRASLTLPADVGESDKMESA
ncbi:MAG: HAMP domain-containing sensor histidine kinase [Myxococcota bacterium]